MRPYVIWAPPYTHRSGGVRALYALCALLRAEGQQAFIQPMDAGLPNVGLWIESPYDAPHVMGAFTAGGIVVYPETIVGNPARSDRVVRWLLGPADRPDLCFQWLPSMGARPVLHVPIVETNLFRPRYSPRSGIAYWVGKASAAHRARWLPPDAQEIHRDVPPTRAALADFLGHLNHVVSLDAFSSLNLEAAMCGTPVRVYSEGGWTRDRLDSPYVSTAGIAFDGDPFKLASTTVRSAHSLYVAAGDLKLESVRRFIAITQEAHQ